MSDIGGTCLGWWQNHIHAETGAARAFAARLRRAASPAEVLSEEQVFELGAKLKLRDPARLALIAQVLASVKEHHSLPVARAFGRKSHDRRHLSELRFRRILSAQGDAELSRALRRALPLVGARCDVARLGRDLFWWTEETRIEWCFQYFGAASDASNQPETAQDEVPQ